MVKYGLTAIVLILVVVDDGLVHSYSILQKSWLQSVLILVVVDDGLVHADVTSEYVIGLVS